jgi:hypothetical protein
VRDAGHELTDRFQPLGARELALAFGPRHFGFDLARDVGERFEDVRHRPGLVEDRLREDAQVDAAPVTAMDDDRVARGDDAFERHLVLRVLRPVALVHAVRLDEATTACLRRLVEAEHRLELVVDVDDLAPRNLPHPDRDRKLLRGDLQLGCRRHATALIRLNAAGDPPARQVELRVLRRLLLLTRR